MPRVTITESELKAMNPCDLENRLALFGDRESLTIRQAFKAGATVLDILWVAGRKGFKAEIVQFAAGCAAAAAAADATLYARYAADAAHYADAAARYAARHADAAARHACAARHADARYAADAAAAAAAAALYAALYAASDARYAADAAADEKKRQRAHLIQLFG